MNILITGATSGIGHQLAIDYQQQGHTVYACGRSESILEQLQELGMQTIAVDLTDREQVLESFSQLPPLQKVILCAGICEHQHHHQFDSITFSRMFEVNLISIGYVLEALWYKMDSPCQLALVGSLARRLPFSRLSGYSGSKAAIYQLACSLRTDLASRKISVHCIEPGFVETPMLQNAQMPTPFKISVSKASQQIQKGLEKKRFLISFPLSSHYLTLLATHLPMSWQNALCRYLARQIKHRHEHQST